MSTEKQMWLPLCCNPDDKLRFIQDHYGLAGYAIIIRLFQAIGATNGWYIEWSTNTAERFAADVGTKSTFVSEIINAATHRGIFDLSLWRKYSVLTSREIQSIHFVLVHNLDIKKGQKAYLLQSAPFSTEKPNDFTENRQNADERSENTGLADNERHKPPKLYSYSSVTAKEYKTVEVSDSNNKCKDNNLLINNTLYSLNKIFRCLLPPVSPKKGGGSTGTEGQGVSAERQHAPPEQAPALTAKAKNKKAVLKDDEAKAIFDRFTDDENERELLTAWYNNRKAARANNTAYAINLNLQKVDEYAKQSGLSRRAYLEQIVMRGWQAFYPLRRQEKAAVKAHTSADDEMEELLKLAAVRGYKRKE